MVDPIEIMLFYFDNFKSLNVILEPNAGSNCKVYNIVFDFQ